MKKLLIAFSVLFVAEYIITSVNAKQSPSIDEIDALLNKVSKNIESASQVTKMAQTMNAKMIELKVEEKEELKKEVEMAEVKMEAMEVKTEMLCAKMIGAGLDTSVAPLKLDGPAYDAYLNYVEEGGKEDFDYFRMYLWQQK